jgi:hypothetical protein
MGTRHITVVVKNNEVRVAQYGQWDGYPGGTGLNILKFLQHNNGENISLLDEKINLCRLIKDDTHPGLVAAFSSHPENFNRDTGSNILRIINESIGPVYLVDYFEFAKDTVFCEWAWVIDLDNRVLDAYKGPKYLGYEEELGPNNRPMPITEPESNDQGIFAKLETETVTKVESFSLDNLPTEDEFRMRFTIVQ